MLQIMKIHIKTSLRIAFIALFFVCIPFYGYTGVMQSGDQRQTVSGTVVDRDGVPLPGVSIYVKGKPEIGISSSLNGKYSLKVSSRETLVFSYIGFVTVERKVSDINPNSLIIMSEESTTLEGVTVVAFGTQKKESVVGSVTTVKPAKLKTTSTNLTQALAGRIAGVISYQRSGEPGNDDASFFIRGVTTFGNNSQPLILIDNVELTTADLARLVPEDIESFSIMKDATATALYGARGANGVIFVKTKEGKEGPARLNVRFDYGISQPTREVELADPIAYMNLANEARLTREPGLGLLYMPEKLENTQLGVMSPAFPAVDWKDLLLKSTSATQKVNLNISGGGDIANYYVSASLDHQSGLFKEHKANNFDTNSDAFNYTLRSNINIKIRKSSLLSIRLSGVFTQSSGPIAGGSEMYRYIMQSNPVMFLPEYPRDSHIPGDDKRVISHVRFGNAEGGKYLNPYAEMFKGFRENGRSNFQAQLEWKEDLSYITEGLSFRALFNTSRIDSYSLTKSMQPFYYQLVGGSYNYESQAYEIERCDPTVGHNYLSLTASDKSIHSNLYAEASVSYKRAFDKHFVSGLLVGQLTNKVQPNAKNLEESYPYRNLGLSGRATYGYDDRYFGEFNFGFNGSERFDDDHRYGFFPSVGLGWMISNEKFFHSSFVDKLKIRVSYGLVGNDNISSTRFLYRSLINPSTDINTVFGENFDTSLKGYSLTRYPNPTVTWEVAKKSNFAIETKLFNSLDITAEYYMESREKILQERKSIPASMGLYAVQHGNIGKAKGQGVDLSLDYNKFFNKDFWIQGRANFTYAKSKFVEYEQLDYPDQWGNTRIGHSINQMYGYIAEGLFVDEQEVKNSPKQFGVYGAGDIKYRDLNGDGTISELDQTAIGYPNQPEIVYGFGASVGYKNLDFSFFFQGSANESFMISYDTFSPFFTKSVKLADGSSKTGITQLAQYIADHRWSESNKNPYAEWPRLSTYSVNNNAQTSTFFLRDASFLRLKQVEIGYTLPEKLTNRLNLRNLRFYLTGNNLLCFSKFKLWDPEVGGNGLNYPLQRTFNVGVNINF